MGLIKAAIIVGGGAYAINKLSKRHEQKKRNRMQLDEGMSQQNRDFSQQQYYYDDYPSEKHSNTRGEKQLYNDHHPQQQTPPSPVHPYALEFVDRRSPQQQHSQSLRLNNNSTQALPPSNGLNNEYYSAQGPPPQYHQTSTAGAPRTRGFVEPDELSSTSETPSAWDRKARRESGDQAFLNTLAQQAIGGDRQGTSSPKEYLENHLSR